MVIKSAGSGPFAGTLTAGLAASVAWACVAMQGSGRRRAGATARGTGRDTLRAARDDPAAFIAYGDPPRVIDEVQLGGGDDLVRAIKVAVDTDQRPSQFLLSGSSRFLTIPTLRLSA